MRISSVVLLVVFLVAVISILCITFVPSVQDFMASNIMWNGIKDFCEESQAQTLDTLADIPESPENTALIIIPYRAPNDDDLTRMRQFIDNGGTLLLFDDYGYGNSILEYLGLEVRFIGGILLDPLFCYKNPNMPKITDFTDQVNNSGIESIVLNHATTLTDAVGGEVIARSPPTSFMDNNENSSWDEGEPNGPFPVAIRFQMNQGVLILVSDPSIMISSMVGRDDNYIFVKYLTTYHGKERKILIDESHLNEATLDVSKTVLLDIREIISTPWVLLIAITLIFTFTSRYIIRIGETND